MELTNIKDIQTLLGRHGFRFSKSMGQNFLTAAWVPQRIAEESGIGPEEGALEVGPGIGVLTEQLALRAHAVAAVELDETLRPILAETLAPYPNASVTFGDALKTDLKALCQEKLGDRPWRVCANLPYNVTTPLVTAFLEAGCFESVTVMVQKEVAQRMCARPGTAEYGAFTVLVDWYTQAEKLFDVPAGCFIPQPKVTSAVVHMARRTQPVAEVLDEGFFFRVVRAAFGQRRKTLSNALCAGINGLTREVAVECMAAVGLDERIRGEKLSTAEFAVLSNVLYHRLNP